MRHVYAYSFKSPLALGQMLARWNEVGPWKWTERDSDRFGEYISTRVLELPQRGMLKVFVDPDGYAINVMLQSDEPNAEEKFGATSTNTTRRHSLTRRLVAMTSSCRTHAG